MRWTLNCILLASIAVISATEDDRTKRDLSFFKNLLSSKFEAAESSPESTKVYVKPPGDYKLFRIPGFEKVLVKAVPKQSGTVDTTSSNDAVKVSEASAIVTQNPQISIVNSYLGTSQLNETLLALQGVKNLLESGVLEAQRRGNSIPTVSYPTYVFESGKIVVNKDQQPLIVGPPYPEPVRFRPVEIARLPDIPIPTKFSYKQTRGDGMTTYTANDNKNVFVTETNRPVPLPPYVTYRIQEAMSLGARVPTGVPVATVIKPAPMPIPVYDVPNVHVAPPLVPPFVVSNHHVNHFPAPQSYVPPVPVNMAVNMPTRYSYQNINSGGDITTYTGSGNVLQSNRPVVETEVTKPMPLPTFFAHRIVNVATQAVNAKTPTHNPHRFYETPMVYNEPPHIMIEERPTYVYDHANHLPPVSVHYNRPLYREDVNLHFAKHKNKQPAVPSSESSKYSYKSVHEDGSVTTYTDNGVHEGNHKEIQKAGAVVYHDKYQEGYHHQHPHLVREEICFDPPFSQYPNINSHVVVHPKPSGYSYSAVHGDGSVTSYSGSGHVDHQDVRPIPVPLESPILPPMVPELVTPEEFFNDNSDSPQKVMFTQPVVSKYVYKQVNHNNPNALTITDADLSMDGQVNVKVGEVPVPKPVLSPPPAPPSLDTTPTLVSPPTFVASKLALPDVTPESFVFIPPSNIKEPLPNGKPAADSHSETGFSYTHVTNEGVHTNTGGFAAFESSTLPPVVNSQSENGFSYTYVTNKGAQSNKDGFAALDSSTLTPFVNSQSETGFSHTHITNEGVHTNKDGFAAFESTTSPPVVKIEKTSTSTSVTKSKSRSKPKFIKSSRTRVSTTTSTTTESSSNLSLSANPIVVLPEEPTFSFKQDRIDGSSITVVGNKDKVSVIEDNKQDDTPHRGDIPSSSY